MDTIVPEMGALKRGIVHRYLETKNGAVFPKNYLLSDSDFGKLCMNLEEIFDTSGDIEYKISHSKKSPTRLSKP